MKVCEAQSPNAGSVVLPFKVADIERINGYAIVGFDPVHTPCWCALLLIITYDAHSYSISKFLLRRGCTVSR
jgi:hypothetical protein